MTARAFRVDKILQRLVDGATTDQVARELLGDVDVVEKVADEWGYPVRHRLVVALDEIEAAHRRGSPYPEVEVPLAAAAAAVLRPPAPAVDEPDEVVAELHHVEGEPPTPVDDVPAEHEEHDEPAPPPAVDPVADEAVLAEHTCPVCSRAFRLAAHLARHRSARTPCNPDLAQHRPDEQETAWTPTPSASTSSSSTTDTSAPATPKAASPASTSTPPSPTGTASRTSRSSRPSSPPAPSTDKAPAPPYVGNDGRPLVEDPTHARIDADLQAQADAMEPQSLGQRVAIENTLQAHRDLVAGDVEQPNPPAPPPSGPTARIDALLEDLQNLIDEHDVAGSDQVRTVTQRLTVVLDQVQLLVVDLGKALAEDAEALVLREQIAALDAAAEQLAAQRAALVDQVDSRVPARLSPDQQRLCRTWAIQAGLLANDRSHLGRPVVLAWWVAGCPDLRALAS